MWSRGIRSRTIRGARFDYSSPRRSFGTSWGSNRWHSGLRDWTGGVRVLLMTLTHARQKLSDSEDSRLVPRFSVRNETPSLLGCRCGRCGLGGVSGWCARVRVCAASEKRASDWALRWRAGSLGVFRVATIEGQKVLFEKKRTEMMMISQTRQDAYR
jgi:hypothetical protein